MSLQSRTYAVDRLLKLLANEERRVILSAFIDSAEDSMSLLDLARYVATENPPPRNVQSDIDELRIKLAHTHLPKLESADIIEYDVVSRTVHYRPQEQVEQIYHFVTDELE